MIPSRCPYAKLDNPQTLNLYDYGFNNPLGTIDPDRHLPCGAGKTQITIAVTPHGSSLSQSPDCDNLLEMLPLSYQQSAINLRNTQNAPANSKPSPQPSNGGEITCAGYARGLEGNPAYVSKTPKGGAFAAWVCILQRARQL